MRLWTTVGRHKPLPVGYIATAIRLIDQLRQLESQNEPDSPGTQ